MEIWKDTPGYEGYQVSNKGRVRSFLNNRHGVCDNFHILHPTCNKQGYPTVCLRRNNRKLVSRLVAEAFIPNPSGLPLVRHMDDTPSNNNAEVKYDKYCSKCGAGLKNDAKFCSSCGSEID